MLRHTPFQTKAKRVMKNKVLIVRPDLSPDDGKENGRSKKIRVSRIVKSYEKKIDDTNEKHRTASLGLMMSRRQIKISKIEHAFVQWKLYVSKSRSDSLERVMELLKVERMRRQNAERALSFYRHATSDGSEWGKV